MHILTTVDRNHSPAPVFTLGSALRWLGHYCPDHCSATIDDLAASVWFLRRRPSSPGERPETLVLVDPTQTGKVLANIRRMIHVVDCCTRAEAIHVRHRRQGEHGPVLAGVWGSVVAGNGAQRP